MTLGRRGFLLGAAGSVLAVSAWGQESRERASLALWATTQNMSVPGLSGLPPGLDLKDLPPDAAAALSSLLGPTRDLQVRLWSPGAAPADATALLDVPAGLNLGKTLPLEIARPERRKEQVQELEKVTGRVPDDFEIRQYWGCYEQVRAGQPRVWKLSDFPAAERERWKALTRAGGGLVEKPDWTEAVWPNSREGAPQRPGARPKVGSLRGEHTLRTSYAGQAAFRVTEPVDFLDPVMFSTPSAQKPPDLKRPIPVAWKAIPNALGYQLYAMAPRGQKLLVMWSGGDFSAPTAAGGEFPQMAEVRQMVEKGVYLAPTTTSCNIPAGIFEGSDAVMLHLVAYGPGQAFEPAGAPAIRVQTRSVGMMTLGGKLGVDLPEDD